MQETRVRSLVWEDALVKEMATPSSILAWKVPWTEEPGGLKTMGLQRVGHDRAINTWTWSLSVRTSSQELARTSSKFLKNPLVIHPSEVLSLKKLVGVYFKINLEANEAF